MKKHTIESNKLGIDKLNDLKSQIHNINNLGRDIVVKYMVEHGLMPSDWENMVYRSCDDIYDDIKLSVDVANMYGDTMPMMLSATGRKIKKNGELFEDREGFTAWSDHWISRDLIPKPKPLFIETLGEFEKLLLSLDEDLGVVVSIGEEIHEIKATDYHSYRGYYQDVALDIFCGSKKHITVGRLLSETKGAIGSSYSGWKGGQFDMDEDSLLWISEEGKSNQLRIVSYEITDKLILNLEKE